MVNHNESQGFRERLVHGSVNFFVTAREIGRELVAAFAETDEPDLSEGDVMYQNGTPPEATT